MPRYKPVEGTFTKDGYSFPFVWERKAVKNYNLRVHRDGSVHLSSPTRVTWEMAEKFLAEKLDFVVRAREKMAAHHPQSPCLFENGEVLPIFDIPHTVCLLKAKKQGAYCDHGTLYLALSNPDDRAARLRLFRRYAAERVLALMQELTAAYAPLFDLRAAPAVSVQWMKSRWGACFYTQNRIKYSNNLIFVPQECARYVACHELAHFKHHDHSAAFHACVARVMPDHKERRLALRAFPLPMLETSER